MVSSVEESQAPVLVGISIGFAILTFIVISLRLFARIYVLGKMSVDDCKLTLIVAVLGSGILTFFSLDYWCLCEFLSTTL